MPFGASIEVLQQIVVLIHNNIKENEELNKNIKIENEIFYLNLKKMADNLSLMIDKLKSYQELSPTTEEIHDLKLRCEKLFNHLSSTNKLLIEIEKNHSILMAKREAYKNKWYLCVERYTKPMFIEDLKDINKQINTKIELLNIEFNDMETLMNIYEKQIENLKFKFIPLRRLWISNKWDQDANQESQRVTISSFIQEIQSKEDLTWNLHNHHYENMKHFLTNMIEIDKTERQLEAIGLGRSCGTYFLNNSLIANLTNLPSEKLDWNNLSDMVLYFSLLPIIRPTDDKITEEIIQKWNEEIKKRELSKTPEEYNKYIKELEENKKKILEIENLKNNNNNIINKIEVNIESNIQKNIDNIIKDVKIKDKYCAYIIKNNQKYIITYKHNSNHTEVYYETTKEGKLGNIELDLRLYDSNYEDCHGYTCNFIREKYEGNYYFYIPPVLWHDGSGHEYSLHYNKNTNIWYLSRFNYSIDTGNGYSGIFVDKGNNKYNILKSRGYNDFLECDFTVEFD